MAETNISLSIISAENVHLKESNETLRNIIKDYTVKYKEKEIQLTNEFKRKESQYLLQIKTMRQEITNYISNIAKLTKNEHNRQKTEELYSIKLSEDREYQTIIQQLKQIISQQKITMDKFEHNLTSSQSTIHDQQSTISSQQNIIQSLQEKLKQHELLEPAMMRRISSTIPFPRMQISNTNDPSSPKPRDSHLSAQTKFGNLSASDAVSSGHRKGTFTMASSPPKFHAIKTGGILFESTALNSVITPTYNDHHSDTMATAVDLPMTRLGTHTPHFPDIDHPALATLHSEEEDKYKANGSKLLENVEQYKISSGTIIVKQIGIVKASVNVFCDPDTSYDENLNNDSDESGVVNIYFKPNEDDNVEIDMEQKQTSGNSKSHERIASDETIVDDDIVTRDQLIFITNDKCYNDCPCVVL